MAEVELGENDLFADPETTRQLMEAMGNVVNGREIGLIAPGGEDKHWFVLFEFDPVGYVPDDEKDSIDKGALLKSISEGTERANRVRARRGFAGLHVIGWYEEPYYDEQTNNLTWALEAESDDGSRVINYNVRLLGREGYTSVTLVTDPATLATDKVEIQRIVSGFTYKPGKRYAEFVAGDKVAAYGLTALIAGGAGAAAVKLGLLAKLGKILAKSWKLVLLALAGLGVGLKRLFGGHADASTS